MNPPTRKSRWLIWSGLLLTLATLLLALLLAQLRLRMAVGKPLPIIGLVADFALTNQAGSAVSLADFRGRVWVADIIFTRCTGPCLKMSRQMKELQQTLPAAAQAKLVTLTTDPTYDTPAILKTYAGRFDANTDRWMFLTGPRSEISKLASGSLKLTALDNPPEKRESPQDLFVHSTIFVIVDKHAQLRGVFETTGEGIDPAQVKTQILAAIRRLEREP
jgi:cytochrome oxidase Cu insertion factor (SCO1/SenC/PrrC family)